MVLTNIHGISRENMASVMIFRGISDETHIDPYNVLTTQITVMQ